MFYHQTLTLSLIRNHVINPNLNPKRLLVGSCCYQNVGVSGNNVYGLYFGIFWSELCFKQSLRNAYTLKYIQNNLLVHINNYNYLQTCFHVFSKRRRNPLVLSLFELSSFDAFKANVKFCLTKKLHQQFCGTRRPVNVLYIRWYDALTRVCVVTCSST